MDIRLSAEQIALREIAQRVVERFGIRTVAALDDAGRRDGLGAAVADAGWCELRMPGDDGQPLATGVEVAIVAEELGRGLADVAFLGPVLASEIRRLAGAAWDEPARSVVLTSGLDRFAIDTDGESLSRARVVDAHVGSTALLLQATDDKYELVTIPVNRTDVRTDLTRSVGCIDPEAIPRRLDHHHPLSEEDLVAASAFGLMITCADLVGVMRGANALARNYAIDRHQYGVAAGSLQAVQHLLADAHVAAEGAASATLYAAWAVDALDPFEAMAAASIAKAYAARAARTVCETSIQVHGGIGNTWECVAHLFLRRALLSIDLFGGVGPNLDRVLAHHRIDPGAAAAANAGHLVRAGGS